MSLCGYLYVSTGVCRGWRHRIWNWSYRGLVVNQLIRMLRVKLRSTRPVWSPNRGVISLAPGVIVLKQYYVVKNTSSQCPL